MSCQKSGRSGLYALAIAIPAFAFVTIAAPDATARRRCIFLECGPANLPNPEPPQAPAVPNIRPIRLPQMEGIQRPRLQGEICEPVRGFHYCVSSILDPQYGFTYNPRNMVDTDLTTAWVEGKSGHGEGESLTVDLNGLRNVAAIQIMNGYHKNERLFLANSRVHVAELNFSNGKSQLIELADSPGLQNFDVGQQQIAWVRFTIRSVYPGERYKDTAVTEFRVVTQQ